MILSKLRMWGRQLSQHTLTVYFAARDPRTPLPARILASLIVAYALSPVDLIPDFIPVLGLLDDLILVPLGLALIIRLTPPAVLESARNKAQLTDSNPVSYAAAALICIAWLIMILLLLTWALKLAG